MAWGKKVIGQDKKGKDIIHSFVDKVECTRADLVARVKKLHRDTAYHRYVYQMVAWMEKLDIATFKGDEEILVKTDFAAAALLRASHSQTCEWPTTANECVAMVLHSPAPLKVVWAVLAR